MEQSYQTTQDELKQSDLKHYDELSTKCNHWSNNIPRAINFYYNYQKMSLIQKILLSFKINYGK
jgi:Tfp pilus assembly PilM family ATPase